MRVSRNDKPMAVKHWSYAGLILTYWCNARCASCHLGCSPDRGEDMSVDLALDLWSQLAAASPHGCRIHLTGGEPFGNWDKLIEICRRADELGLSSPGGKGPLEKVETNAFWATDESIIRTRLTQLIRAGMNKLGISADPYHQQFVPIANCRRLAAIADEMLGPKRVMVRWRDWLQTGFDTADMTQPDRTQLFATYSQLGRERLTGRAASLLAPTLRTAPDKEHRKNIPDFADISCRGLLLRSRHVHIDGATRVMPGTCAGIILGNAAEGVANLWRRLRDDHDTRPIVGELSRHGPAGLAIRTLNQGTDFVPRQEYLSNCDLCWHLRSFLAHQSPTSDELGPKWLYNALNE